MDHRVIERITAAIAQQEAVRFLAITGSQAVPARVDARSDLDLIVVLADPDLAGPVGRWWPPTEPVLLHDVHLDRHHTFVLPSLDKVDVALYVGEDWRDAVVNGVRVVRGDAGFAKGLAAAERRTRGLRRCPPPRDVSLRNLTLLALGAHRRLARGERLGGATLLRLAADMWLQLRSGPFREDPRFDPRDPGRHLEVLAPTLAAQLAGIQFVEPSVGLRALCVAALEAEDLGPAERQILELCSDA